MKLQSVSVVLRARKVSVDDIRHRPPKSILTSVLRPPLRSSAYRMNPKGTLAEFVYLLSLQSSPVSIESFLSCINVRKYLSSKSAMFPYFIRIKSNCKSIPSLSRGMTTTEYNSMLSKSHGAVPLRVALFVTKLYNGLDGFDNPRWPPPLLID